MGKLSSALRQYERDTLVVSRHGGGLGSSTVRGCLTQLLAAQQNGVMAGFPPSSGWALSKAVRATQVGISSHTK